jgi:hypothetical protein
VSTEDPIAYTALAKGVALLSASGKEFGRVEHVLQDESLDLFDGIAVKTSGGLRFVDAGQVVSITTSAVTTSLTDDEAANLPAPEGNAVLGADPEEFQGNGLSAWFGRMFMREHWTRNRD